MLAKCVQIYDHHLYMCFMYVHMYAWASICILCEYNKFIISMNKPIAFFYNLKFLVSFVQFSSTYQLRLATLRYGCKMKLVNLDWVILWVIFWIGQSSYNIFEKYLHMNIEKQVYSSYTLLKHKDSWQAAIQVDNPSSNVHTLFVHSINVHIFTTK